MPEKIYSFNGKDITMNVCIQIRAVVKLLQERFHIAFEEAVVLFYKSETYKTLQETENGLWAESAEYIDITKSRENNTFLTNNKEQCQS